MIPHDPLRIASAHGLATYASDGSVLDVWFPDPHLGNLEDAAKVAGELAAAAQSDAERGTTQSVVSLEIDVDVAPADTADV